MVKVIKGRSRRLSTRKQNPPRAKVLAQLIEQHKCKKGVELGVFAGQTYFYLLERFPDLTLTGIDIFEHGKVDNDQGARSYRQFPLHKYFEQIMERKEAFGDRAVLIRGDTADSVRLVKNKVDFVFIDGDHTYEGVKRDIEAWLPKIKKRGFIAGHDIDMSSVKKAVTELLPNYSNPGEVVWYCPL